MRQHDIDWSQNDQCPMLYWLVWKCHVRILILSCWRGGGGDTKERQNRAPIRQIGVCRRPANVPALAQKSAIHPMNIVVFIWCLTRLSTLFQSIAAADYLDCFLNFKVALSDSLLVASSQQLPHWKLVGDENRHRESNPCSWLYRLT